MLPYLTSNGHIPSHVRVKPTALSGSFFFFLPFANTSFSVFQHESNTPIPLSLSSRSHFPPSFPSYLSPPSSPLLPSPSFFPGFQFSLHAHLLSTIDNIPDGAPLLATHGQINQSNNTPINSNYALISPGRALLGAGGRM